MSIVTCTGCRGNKVKIGYSYMVPVIPLIAVVTAKVEFSLFAYSGNTAVVMVLSGPVYGSVCNITTVTLVALETGEGSSRANVSFSMYGYLGNTGCSGNGGNRSNVGFIVYGYTACSDSGQCRA